MEERNYQEGGKEIDDKGAQANKAKANRCP
jgi:hypothetical protein